MAQNIVCDNCGKVVSGLPEGVASIQFDSMVLTFAGKHDLCVECLGTMRNLIGNIPSGNNRGKQTSVTIPEAAITTPEHVASARQKSRLPGPNMEPVPASDKSTRVFPT